MTIQQLEYFLSVAELGSFSKAAERAYVSQPAISKQITLLEKELGVTLFDRRYRKAMLTPPGDIIYETLSRHRAEFDVACREAKRRFRQWNNAVWISLPENCGLGNLHQVLGQFQRENPNVMLKVYSGAGRELAVRSSGDDFDLILTPQLLPMERMHVQTQTLYKGNYVMLVSRSHPRYHPGLTPGEMAGENLYLAAPGPIAREVEAVQRITEDYGLGDSEVLVLPTPESVIGATRGALGAGVVNDLVTIPPCYDLEVIPLKEFFALEMAWREENENPFLPALRKAIMEQAVICPDPV